MSGGYLLLRGAGSLWGLASAAVRGLARRDGAYRVETAGGTLAVEEVLGVAPLAVRPLPALLHRFWPEIAAGWAVVAGEPVMVVDPQRPPRALRVQGSVQGSNEEGNEHV
jgi:hypothetical protein